MTAVTDVLALACTTAGLLAVGLAGVTGGRWRAGATVGLDLWVAAGLLRLSGAPDLSAVAAAAAVITVRRLVVAQLGSTAPSARC
ncbi:MAG: hypothetical protein M3493_11455 [Actinomycetota bacterium]|nr:hypothetical protein [Euzebyaceae bacterium]MDQ3453294.1 hypothetical protein [Actinomycetota bacterium]